MILPVVARGVDRVRKIPTLFKRDYESKSRLVYDELTPGTEWVVAGEGVATLKVDGTCCLVKDGSLYKRYELKAGRVAPDDFLPAQQPDLVTGDIPGWLPVGDGPEDKWHRDALKGVPLADGTYELVGPRINGNPNGFPEHMLVAHADVLLVCGPVPRDFNGLQEWLSEKWDCGLCPEGIVFWRKHGDPDSEMVKIKAKDFGIAKRRLKQ